VGPFLFPWGARLVVIREMQAHDRSGVAALETVFETSTVYDVVTTARRVELVPRALAVPLVKRYPIADVFADWARWDTAWVAEAGGAIVGFAATEYEDWHSRAVLWHLYVDPRHRRAGIARELLERVEEHARLRGAERVWLETSSVNVPGIAFYERMGFSLCGADATFYAGTYARDEAAIFLAKSVRSSV
jgi:ribosomal protein S18 acetylase RimI-like enzyme